MHCLFVCSLLGVLADEESDRIGLFARFSRLSLSSLISPSIAPSPRSLFPSLSFLLSVFLSPPPSLSLSLSPFHVSFFLDLDSCGSFKLVR